MVGNTGRLVVWYDVLYSILPPWTMEKESNSSQASSAGVIAVL